MKVKKSAWTHVWNEKKRPMEAAKALESFFE